MEKFATENLILLEFLIEDVIFDYNERTDLQVMSGETLVVFQFLDNAPLLVAEEEFSQRKKTSGMCPDPNLGNVKQGKSCLFSVTPDQAQDALKHFDVFVEIFKKTRPGMLPDRVKIGDSVISIVNLFKELMTAVVKRGENATAKVLKGMFKITNLTGQNIGKIKIFIRLSCFGKLIVTQFQMNLNQQSVEFKAKKGHYLFTYDKKDGRCPPECPGIDPTISHLPQSGDQSCPMLQGGPCPPKQQNLDQQSLEFKAKKGHYLFTYDKKDRRCPPECPGIDPTIPYLPQSGDQSCPMLQGGTCPLKQQNSCTQPCSPRPPSQPYQLYLSCQPCPPPSPYAPASCIPCPPPCSPPNCPAPPCCSPCSPSPTPCYPCRSPLPLSPTPCQPCRMRPISAPEPNMCCMSPCEIYQMQIKQMRECYNRCNMAFSEMPPPCQDKFQEIGASMGKNAVTIRVRKDAHKKVETWNGDEEEQVEPLCESCPKQPKSRKKKSGKAGFSSKCQSSPCCSLKSRCPPSRGCPPPNCCPPPNDPPDDSQPPLRCPSPLCPFQCPLADCICSPQCPQRDSFAEQYSLECPLSDACTPQSFRLESKCSPPPKCRQSLPKCNPVCPQPCRLSLPTCLPTPACCYYPPPAYCYPPPCQDECKKDDPDKETFILKIGKKNESSCCKRNDLELQVCTPKGKDLKPRPQKETRGTLYNMEDMPDDYLEAFYGKEKWQKMKKEQAVEEARLAAKYGSYNVGASDGDHGEAALGIERHGKGGDGKGKNRKGKGKGAGDGKNGVGSGSAGGGGRGNTIRFNPCDPCNPCNRCFPCGYYNSCNPCSPCRTNSSCCTDYCN